MKRVIKKLDLKKMYGEHILELFWHNRNPMIAAYGTEC